MKQARTRLAVVAGALFAIAAAAGCGSGGGSSGASSGGSQQQALDAFLTAYQPLREQGNAYSDKVDAALQQVTSSNVASWPGIAAQMKAPGEGVATVAAKLAALTPPAPLAAPWQAYATAAHRDGAILGQIERDLAAKDRSAVAGWNSTVVPELEAQHTKTTAFRQALIAYAARQHLTLPAWAKRIGTGKN